MPILKLQFLNAVLWRKNEGKKKEFEGNINDFEQLIHSDSFLQNLWVETQLPVMRKVFAVVYLIKSAVKSISSNDQILVQIAELTSDSSELDFIQKYLLES
jgi:hypothetical protein